MFDRSWYCIYSCGWDHLLSLAVSFLPSTLGQTCYSNLGNYRVRVLLSHVEDVEAPSDKRRQCSFDTCTAQVFVCHAKLCICIISYKASGYWLGGNTSLFITCQAQRAQYPLLCIVGLCNNQKNNCDILRYSHKIIVIIYNFAIITPNATLWTLKATSQVRNRLVTWRHFLMAINPENGVV